jgi:hypothetical protein
MNDIYKYINDEFDRRNVMERISEISREIEEEQTKPQDEQDNEKRLRLINRQFMEGLKLSTGFNCYW